MRAEGIDAVSMVVDSTELPELLLKHAKAKFSDQAELVGLLRSL